MLAYAGYRLAPAARGTTVMAAGLPVMTSLIAAAAGIATITRAPVAGAWRGDLLFLGAVAY